MAVIFSTVSSNIRAEYGGYVVEKQNAKTNSVMFSAASLTGVKIRAETETHVDRL